MADVSAEFAGASSKAAQLHNTTVKEAAGFVHLAAILTLWILRNPMTIRHDHIRDFQVIRLR